MVFPHGDAEWLPLHQARPEPEGTHSSPTSRSQKYESICEILSVDFVEVPWVALNFVASLVAAVEGEEPREQKKPASWEFETILRGRGQVSLITRSFLFHVARRDSPLTWSTASSSSYVNEMTVEESTLTNIWKDI